MNFNPQQIELLRKIKEALLSQGESGLWIFFIILFLTGGFFFSGLFYLQGRKRRGKLGDFGGLLEKEEFENFLNETCLTYHLEEEEKKMFAHLFPPGRQDLESLKKLLENKHFFENICFEKQDALIKKGDIEKSLEIQDFKNSVGKKIFSNSELGTNTHSH